MSKIICICPTHRDYRELAAVKDGHTLLHHDYASLALEDLTAEESPSETFIGSPEPEARGEREHKATPTPSLRVEQEMLTRNLAR